MHYHDVDDDAILRCWWCILWLCISLRSNAGENGICCTWTNRLTGKVFFRFCVKSLGCFSFFFFDVVMKLSLFVLVIAVYFIESRKWTMSNKIRYVISLHFHPGYDEMVLRLKSTIADINPALPIVKAFLYLIHFLFQPNDHR